MTQYLFRLDDICPTMRWSRFVELCQIFDVHQIQPILAVIPDAKDPGLAVDPPHENFWPTIASLKDKGWILAQHGYQHAYQTVESGILGLRRRSEFSGLTDAEQRAKISAGQAVFADKLGFTPQWWSAPAHSFDFTTCQVLRELGFTHISDGIALFPFEKYGLMWVPHQTWSCRAKPLGLWTIGLHLNTMTDHHVQRLRKFLAQHFPACQNIDLTPRRTSLDPLFRFGWYTQFYVWYYGKSIF